MMVGVENLRSRFNSALGPCVPGILRVLPGAARPVVTETRRIRPAPRPAVYRRLRDHRFGGRRRGRGAGELPPLGGAGRAARRQVENPRAYLARIATRQALNRLRSRSRQREDYVGPWLPEPLVTGPDMAQDVVLAESVSMAMMLVVESLPGGAGRLRAA